MARSEIALASTFREVQASDFASIADVRHYIISNIHALRKWRQKGVVAQFQRHISMPISWSLSRSGRDPWAARPAAWPLCPPCSSKIRDFMKNIPKFNIEIPKTLVISTDGFESFVSLNHLQRFALDDYPDEEMAEGFLKAEMPEWLEAELETYLAQVKYPLSVRSSSLLEDAQFQPYAGLYQTYMIPNNHPDFSNGFSILSPQ